MKTLIYLVFSIALTGCGGHYVHMSSDLVDLGPVAGATCKGMNKITRVTSVIPPDEAELGAQHYKEVTPSGFVETGYDCYKRSIIRPR